MKILLIGTVKFSEAVLSKLISMKENVVGVITKPYSNFNSDYADLTPICNNNEIPVKYTMNINDKDVEDWIKKLEPDVALCVGWSQIIKENILKIPKLGVIGYHPAKLPRNRGRHPIIWALFLGLEETASTFFLMDKGMDSGDIVSQRKVPILYEDDASTLYEKITNVALLQIEEIINAMNNGNLKMFPQDHSIATAWRKRGTEDGKIDFRMCSRAIYNLVRALTKPYIGAHISYMEKDIKVWKVEEMEYNINDIEPGYVLEVDGNGCVVVKTYDGAIKIVEHEFDVIPKRGEYL